MTTITKKTFGTTSTGVDVDLYTLDNGSMKVSITNYGGTVVSILVPDKNGDMKDVALGYDTIGEYQTRGGFLGALIGRCGNRIEKGEFELNGQTYHLYLNDGNNHLHGGKIGFDKKVWNVEIMKGATGDELELKLFSPDGDENYPGNLNVTVVYKLTEENGLVIDYRAVSDRDTVCNLTNHTYFNLAGQDSGKNVLDHKLKLYAEKYTVGNDETLPNGIIADVVGTPYDFIDYHVIGERIHDDEPGLVSAHGYDHNWVLNGADEDDHSDKLPIAAEAVCPDTGIKMAVYTNKPGIQFYCGNGLSDQVIGKGGVKYQPHAGFCLETQFFPNAMKHKNFPSPVLKAGSLYSFTTEYRFSVEK